MHQQAVFYDDILSRGRVEVCQGGEYNAICADSDQLWDNTDAMVICRELGLSPYGQYYNYYYMKITRNKFYTIISISFMIFAPYYHNYNQMQGQLD